MKKTIRQLVTLMVLLLAGTAHAQWWNYYDEPPKMEEPRPTDPPFIYTRDTYLKACTVIQQAFRLRDYARLEKMHTEFVQMKLRATDGTWMVQSFECAFDALFYVPDAEANTKRFDEWHAKVPGSSFYAVAKAAAWQRQAWSARGGRTADRTPAENFETFKEWIGNAGKALAEAGEGGKQSPIWHWVALIVAGSSGQPARELDRIFKEGTQRFPTYQPLYFTRVNYLLPKWGGSYEEVDKFIRASQKNTEKYDGRSFYAWIYVDIARHEKGDFIFRETKAQWPLMKAAFEDMVKRYPDNWTQNLFGSYACLARDKETTAAMLAKLGKDARMGVWSSGISNETCMKMAMEKA